MKRTSSENSIVDENPNIPALRLALHDEMDLPQCLWRITHGEQHDDTDDRHNSSSASQEPEESLLQGPRVQDPVQHGSHGQLGDREGENTKQEADSVEHDGQFHVG